MDVRNAFTQVASTHFFCSRENSEYKDPERFIPERWLRVTNDEYSHNKAHVFSYMPFGFGSRSCIGRRIANVELEVTIIRIIRTFKLSWNYGDMRFGGKLFYGPEDPLRITAEEIDC